ncbi:hypothetical protein PWT90_07492 [Aphanocladium album]|nr:hypothetical protein PWT90_07492 [Aphanocladium album]
MKASLGFVLYGSLATAAALAPRASPSFDVKLERAGNTLIKAIITNTGEENVRILNTANILDHGIPVKKTDVFSDGKPLKFQGVYARVEATLLEDANFEDMGPKSSVESTFDIAELYDLSAGGRFTVRSSGSLSFSGDVASNQTTAIAGAVSFSSNELTIDVDGGQAGRAKSLTPMHAKRLVADKRTVVQGDCQGSNRDLIGLALFMCTGYAAYGRGDALDYAHGSPKLREFFKRDDPDARNYIAAGLGRVHDVCVSPTSGDTSIFCTDRYQFCRPGVWAYTVPNDSNIIFCPVYFGTPVTEFQGCHQSDSGTTLMHEVTHLQQTLGTADYDTYGYDGLRRLSSDQNMNHADTYTFYAQAVLRCRD